ncbi:L(+)-tartrate dehydratase subunit beta [Pyramidobacter piscolens]|uniref:L(+)-tartrate dehydratase subunit beta n=2 Tax=Bacteria TaxID=2 RepID=UPI003AB2B163
MVERINGKTILTTPISAEDLKGIKIGDIVYLNGSMTTCRDVAHRRLVEEGRELPVDVRNNAIFHAGPIIRPLENDKFEMVSVGPTTSMRMEKFEYEFVKETGVRVIIGKGGMKENTERACKEFGAIHCVFPAGNAVVAATEVEEIVRAEWRDLGMPETLWNCRVKEFVTAVFGAQGRPAARYYLACCAGCGTRFVNLPRGRCSILPKNSRYGFRFGVPLSCASNGLKRMV